MVLCLELLLLGRVHGYMGIDVEAQSLGKYHKHFLRILLSRFPKGIILVDFRGQIRNRLW